MVNPSQFELHPAAASQAVDALPSADAPPAPRHAPLAIGPDDGLLWVAVDPSVGTPSRAATAAAAVAGLRVVYQGLAPRLVLIARGEHLLVNGLPALPFSVLAAQDTLVLAAGCLCYVTERIRPFVGAPTGELLGKKCPFCRIPADGATRVVTCRCGAVYHHETEESHPSVAEADRLRCLEKIKACLSCGRPVTVNEYLAWDPAGL